MSDQPRATWDQLLAYVEGLKEREPSDRLNALRQVHTGLTQQPHQGNWVQVRAQVRNIINERIGVEGGSAFAAWDPIHGRLENQDRKIPKRGSGEEIDQSNLKTPIIGVLQRLQRSEITTESAITELRRLAKIAGTAAATALLQELLKRFLDKETINTQNLQSFELEVMEIAGKHPAPDTKENDVSDHESDREPDAGNAPPPYKGRDQYDSDPTRARAQIGNDLTNDEITLENFNELHREIMVEIANINKVINNPPPPATPAPPVVNVTIPEQPQSNNGLYMLIGVVTAALIVAVGVIVAAILWPDGGNNNAPASVNVTVPNTGGNQNGNNVNTGSNNGSGSPSTLLNGEVDSDGNGIADETRHDLAMIPGDGTCPTDKQVQAALGGLTVHWISGCLFKWNSNNVDFVTRPCPQGWYCTLDIGAENVAWNGDSKNYRFEGGSFWPLADKTFDNECTYLRHENVYAGIVGDPPTLAGNFSCDGAGSYNGTGVVSGSSSTTTTTSATATPNPTAAGNGCMISSSADAARLIGGDAGNWAQLEPGVFKYRNKGTYSSGFKHPGGVGRLDYWGDGKPEALTSAGEVPFKQDEMTFHCNPND